MTAARPPLRRGWTTGACATAAAKAAYIALVSGTFPDPVEIALPIGKRVAFALAREELSPEYALAGIVKDAGDDPDVTHGALVLATVRRGERGASVSFRAGAGVGTVTKPGLPLGVGEPAINPVPRAMMRASIAEAAHELGDRDDIVIEIAVENGATLAQRTMNGRLGIVGGLSILGTTGVVIPYSCSAWIAAIHEGIDVARALGLKHVAGSTGSTSEATVARFFDFEDSALIDMGDFVGGMLKYVRRHPIERVTIAGGFAKLAKLAQGHLDVHSQRSQLDVAALAQLVADHGGSAELMRAVAQAHSGLDALRLCEAEQIPLAEMVAARARETALRVLDGANIQLDVLIVDRDGEPIAWAQ